MRYQNWDVLVFPEQCKIPLQEFKTNCQVIQDPESLNPQANPLLLPTVTSFIPGLPAGAPFRISVHCWENPEISRYVQNLKKPTDKVAFEVRLFIDGRLAGSKWFPPYGPWPAVIDLSPDLDKNGEFEKLRFPSFHKELLQQNYWSPGDDLGRIKVIIAEGFNRENPTYPFDRLKNVISFSFQHAPLEVLETSSIAWPNPAMWRQVAIVGPYFVQQFSPRNQLDAVELHSHSPRQAHPSVRPSFSIPTLGSMGPPNAGLLPRQPHYDPFIEPQNSAFSHWRQRSTDISMHDYSSSHTRSSSSRQVSDPMVTDRRQESLSMIGAYDTLCEALIPSAPANTPKSMGEFGPFDMVKSTKSHQEGMAKVVHDSPTDAAPSVISAREQVELTTIKYEKNEPDSHAGFFHGFATLQTAMGKKKSIQDSPDAQSVNIAENANTLRKVSQFSNVSNGGTKRQRIVTPASSKVIDDEDEPKNSPTARAPSRVPSQQLTMNPEGQEVDRIILSEVQNH